MTIGVSATTSEAELACTTRILSEFGAGPTFRVTLVGLTGNRMLYEGTDAAAAAQAAHGHKGEAGETLHLDADDTHILSRHYLPPGKLVTNVVAVPGADLEQP